MSALTLARHLVRRSLKPVVMVGIVGTLSVSLIVSTPANAYAFDPYTTTVLGATRMAIPALMPTAAILGPVGWGVIGVAALGIGLYATKDYWLPYVTGTFGNPQPNTQPASTPYAEPGLTVGDSSVTGAVLTARYIYQATNTTSGWTTIGQAIFKCKRNSDGFIRYQRSSFTQSQPNRTTSWDRTFTMAACPTSDTTLGFMVGGGTPRTPGEGFLPNANMSQQPIQFDGNSGTVFGSHGPTNIMAYGDFMGGGFDPRSPEVKYRAQTECISPDGKYSTAEALSTGADSGVKLASCEAAGKGHGTGKVTVWATPPGGAPEKIQWETQRATEDPAQPLCSPSRPSSGCKLGVLLDGQPCVVGSVECENWTTLRNDPNHSTRLSCQYGPYAVAIETCNPLERAYEPGGSPATEPNVDGNPATRSDTMPNGQPQPKPDVGVAPGGFPSTGTNPDDPCLARAWSWNPADFVKSPVLCAMKDAFVPKMDIQARSNELKQKALDTVPIAWLGSPILGPSGGGCPNWTINVAGLSKNVVCDSSFTAALLGVRTPLFILVGAAMVWPLIRGIWYASIPVLRVAPGSTK